MEDVLGALCFGTYAAFGAFFAAKPKMVIKGGLINWAEMGDPNASLPTPQPIIYRPMYGAFGKAMPRTCVRFVSQASVDNGVAASYGVDNIIYGVHGTRQLGKANMLRNSATPHIEVDPETFNVYVDGVLAYVDPAKDVPLAQLYWFSYGMAEFERYAYDFLLWLIFKFCQVHHQHGAEVEAQYGGEFLFGVVGYDVAVGHMFARCQGDGQSTEKSCSA